MKTKILSILALLLTVTQGAWALDGSGTPEDPYLIKVSQDWWDFADGVNNGTLSSKCAKMMADMGYTAITIGTSEHPFTGTFDGNGFTVERGNGPENPFFPYVSGATIKNLVVAGTFSFTETHKGALIGESTGNTTVENCRVSANITYGTTSVNGGTIVGFASAGALTMRGCVFDGTITAPDSFSDFGGLMSKFNSSATATIQNCVVNPSSVTGTPSRYNEHFSRGGSSISNSYYLCEPTAYISYPENYPEGGTGNVSTDLKGRSISAGTDVTALTISGAGTEYNVSGITAYSTGIKYNGVYYASNGQNVTLTLSHADKAGYTFSQYTATPGTLSGSTLTMTDADQTVSAQYTPIASYNVTANSASEAYWATFYSNAGNYQAPEGTQVFTVSLAGTGITMNEVSDRIAKSGEGVVLKKTTTGNFTMTLTETAPAGDFSGNSLTGTMTVINTTGANDYYVLGGKSGAGFYKLSNTSGTIGANKAYLTYSGGGAAAARGFFLFDETTGIEMPTAEDGNADAVVFDLQGRRVLNPTKGLYIVNGKKVFINK